MFYNKVSKASEKKISFGISRCGDNCVYGYVNCKATDIFYLFEILITFISVGSSVMNVVLCIYDSHY